MEQEAEQDRSRLYVLEDGDDYHFDYNEVWELDIEPYHFDPDMTFGDQGPWIVEEWTTQEPSKHFPNVKFWLEDFVADLVEEMGEGAMESYQQASNDPDVIAAFVAAFDLMASKVTYRETDKKVANHVIRLDEDGEPLWDGERMYHTREVEGGVSPSDQV